MLSTSIVPVLLCERLAGKHRLLGRLWGHRKILGCGRQIKLRLFARFRIVLPQERAPRGRPVLQILPRASRIALRIRLPQLIEIGVQMCRQLRPGDRTPIGPNEGKHEKSQNEWRVLGYKQPPRGM